MWLPIITSLLFFLLLFFFDRSTPGSEIFQIESLWFYDLQKSKELQVSPKINEFIFPEVFSLRHKEEIWSFYFSDQRQVKKIVRDDLVYVPIFSDAWYQYTKNQSRIIYKNGHSDTIYWEKDFYGYPISDTLGKNLIILSGDHSSFNLYDNNGQWRNTYSGLYISHFCQDHDVKKPNRQIVLFADGKFIVINDEKSMEFEIIEKNRTFFLKSCSLSSDGNTLIIHTLVQESGEVKENDAFYLYTFNSDNEPIFQKSYPIEESYPHLLSMAVNSHGLLFGSKTATFYISFEDDDLNWRKEKEKQMINFRPVFALKDYLLYSEKKDLYLIGNQGKELLRVPMPREPLRFIHLPIAEREMQGRPLSEESDRQAFLIQFEDALQIIQIW